jgi:hypothetical protein
MKCCHVLNFLLLTLASSTLAATSAQAQTIINVSDSTSFATACNTIFFNPGVSYIVNINSSFTMTGVVAPLQVVGSSTITVNGNGNTINGGGLFRPFFVLNGTVNINNLTVSNAAAIGGSGGLQTDIVTTGGGGGGGLGAGGGLFVNSTATVALSNVSFINNQAKGGNGGASSFSGPAVAGGGGGGLGGAGPTATD